MEKIEKEEIQYERIIAGALLNFESLDMFDFSLLAEDFRAKTNSKITCLFYYSSSNNLEKYIKTLQNGTVKLRDDISLDDFIEEENRTLRDKLSEISGNLVNNYFNNLKIEELKQDKEKVLNTTNILLISDIQDDYDELIKYGFKNVDYFKSFIRADQYFNKNPDELEKYHIILKGNQNAKLCCFDVAIGLDRKIAELSKKILIMYLNRYVYPNHMELQLHIIDNINHIRRDIQGRTYTAIFDGIIRNILTNHTLEKMGLKVNKFVPIQDYINPNRFLPTKKSDLKILYLDSINDCVDKIANELGLNIDFEEENNFSLGKSVKNNLGKYDIIIATSSYSNNLLGMNYESTEQCKDTGRELTLLVVRTEFYVGHGMDLADEIRLEYVFGGNYAPDSECHSKDIRILRQPIEVKIKAEKKYSQMKGIIEASVNFYNQALLQTGKSVISDLDLKTAEEIDQDYINAFKNKEAIREAELASIKSFDNMQHSIKSYLNYRKKGLINNSLEGLKITEGKDGIKVENIYQGRTLCTVVFPKKFKGDELRVFEIQTISKKGMLSSPQTIGVYTSKYENVEGIPNRPDEKQESALISIEKKINVALRPLNEEAQKKLLEKEVQKAKTLNLKRI